MLLLWTAAAVLSQRTIGAALYALDEGFVGELREPVTGYPLDFVHVGRRLAIDVDGKYSYTRSGGAPRPVGATLLRRRLLRAAGWRVRSIPYFEWHARHHTEQSDYLSKVVEGDDDDDDCSPSDDSLLRARRRYAG